MKAEKSMNKQEPSRGQSLNEFRRLTGDARYEDYRVNEALNPAQRMSALMDFFMNSWEHGDTHSAISHLTQLLGNPDLAKELVTTFEKERPDLGKAYKTLPPRDRMQKSHEDLKKLITRILRAAPKESVETGAPKEAAGDPKPLDPAVAKKAHAALSKFHMELKGLREKFESDERAALAATRNITVSMQKPGGPLWNFGSFLDGDEMADLSIAFNHALEMLEKAVKELDAASR
jgi:hypothetical protein